MRLWNLDEFPKLETIVVQPYGAALHKRRRRSRRCPSPFKVAVAVAALSTAFSIGTVQANRLVTNIPVRAASIAQSIPEPPSPMAEFFNAAFDAEWTEAIENELLMRVETNRLQGASRSLTDQTVDVVFSNQFEEPGEVRAGGMSREQVAALAKARKRT